MYIDSKAFSFATYSGFLHIFVIRDFYIYLRFTTNSESLYCLLICLARSSSQLINTLDCQIVFELSTLCLHFKCQLHDTITTGSATHDTIVLFPYFDNGKTGNPDI